MGGLRATTVAALAGTSFFISVEVGEAQVVAEPALLTAGIPESEIFLPYIAFPQNSFVIGGMLRFPVGMDVDIGARAGLWLIDDGKDSPYAGVDVRWGLLGRQLDPGGGLFAVSFDTGIGVSDPGPTVWKVPIGFIAGIGFRLGGGDSEIFANPRAELVVSSGDDDFDSALLLDVGALLSIKERLAALLDFRFGKGVFGEGDNVVVAIGLSWRL